MRIDFAADQAMLDAVHAPHARRPWLQLLVGGDGAGRRQGRTAAPRRTALGQRDLLRQPPHHRAGFTGAEAMAAGEAFIAALPEHEFAIPRQLVADAAVVAVEHVAVPEVRMTVEAELLLLEDG